MYEALLTNPQSIARVQAARHAIQQLGGRVEIQGERGSPVQLVTLWLPAPHTPDEALPGLPFFPA